MTNGVFALETSVDFHEAVHVLACLHFGGCHQQAIVAHLDSRQDSGFVDAPSDEGVDVALRFKQELVEERGGRDTSGGILRRQ